MLWMVWLSVLLFRIPTVGPLVAGHVGEGLALLLPDKGLTPTRRRGR